MPLRRTVCLWFLIASVFVVSACDLSRSPDPEPSATTGLVSSPTPDLADLPPWKRRNLPPEPIQGVVHGDTYWAVYLAIDEGTRVTSKLRRAARLWERREMHPSTHDLACDRGARAVLGLPRKMPYTVVSTYFFERESARELASIAGLPKKRVAPVQVFCLD